MRVDRHANDAKWVLQLWHPTTRAYCTYSDAYAVVHQLLTNDFDQDYTKEDCQAHWSAHTSFRGDDGKDSGLLISPRVDAPANACVPLSVYVYMAQEANVHTLLCACAPC